MQTDFPIVGIGASAGGLKAIEELLLNLPKDTGMAFIIIQHLSRRYKSLMQEILGKDTDMPVVMAEDGAQVEPNHVYLIPAGHNMTINDSTLFLQDQAREERPYFVIDVFLNSLGQDVKSNAIAVILSGTGTDGSRGIRTVKEAGGIVIVQEPDSGEFDGMPLSAIDTKIVDFVLPPKEIAEKLTQLGKLEDRHSDKLQLVNGELSEEDPPLSHELSNILDLVKKYYELDFKLYKINTVQRRIDKHMSMNKFRDMKKYYTYLAKNPTHVEELLEELLIGVTEFFRDKPAYEALREHVYPNLINQQRDKRELRVWVCACSTGEEVYSIAIDMEEYASELGFYPKYTILATDVDEKSLSIASKGHYTPSKMASIPDNLVDKYFNYNGEKYEIKNYIRDRIIFARNDATIDPPFINLDLVVCRNLLIYLQPQIQRRLLLNFHFGLKPGGLMWLGSSENVTDFKSSFTTLNEKWKIFQTRGETPKSRKNYVFLNPKRGNRIAGISRSNSQKVEDYQLLRNTRIFYAKLLLDKYAPACAVIDEDFNLLYLAGGVGKYLSLPDMELSYDLLSMVSEPTVLVLRDGIRRLSAEEGPLLYPNLESTVQHKKVQCDIQIQKIGTKLDRKLFLIEWRQETKEDQQQEAIKVVEPVKIKANAYEIIKDLQNELSLARQEVQNSLEELETSNEELQAANEELLAANEELQSTNEELQSVNEELYTVNSELQARNRELTEANFTIDNLLASTNIGTLFLDSELQVRFFTPAFTKVIDLVESDIGINIKKFRINWEYPNFIDDILQVIDNGKSINKEIAGKGIQAYYMIRLNPYLRENRIDGVIVNMIDVTEQKKVELELKVAEENQRKILDAIPVEISILDPSGNILYHNYKSNGKTQGSIENKNILRDITEGVDSQAKKAFQKSIQEQSINTIENEVSSENGSTQYRSTFAPLKIQDGEVMELLMARINLTNERIISNAAYKKFHSISKLLEESSIIATIKDSHFRYIYTNQGLTKLLKKPREYIIGSNDYALFSEEIARQLRHNDEWVLREKKELSTIENYSFNDNKIKAVVLKFHTYLNNSKEPFLAQLAIVHNFDMMEQLGQGEQSQMKLEQLVDERTEALSQANQELRTITRSIAHDLRSPLRAINMFGQILDKDFRKDMEKTEGEYLDNILRQSGRMGTILDGLLDYVKLGSIEVRKEWIETKSLALEVWEDLQYLQKEEDCDLVLRNCPALWGDLSLIKQILTNLFSNALKYKKPKKKCLVEFGAHNDNRTKELVFFVKDNGLGFDQKYSEKIFGVFERLHEAKDSEGHGIGLSIVKKSIELQGGSVWASSQIGIGSTFYFSFPKKISDDAF